jgi:hypothetical protein
MGRKADIDVRRWDDCSAILWFLLRFVRSEKCSNVARPIQQFQPLLFTIAQKEATAAKQTVASLSAQGPDLDLLTAGGHERQQ